MHRPIKGCLILAEELVIPLVPQRLGVVEVQGVGAQKNRTKQGL